MQFTLSIELGNDVMQTPSEVAAALGRVSEKLARRGEFYPDEGGVLMDENGNSVGAWHIEYPRTEGV